MIKRIYCIPTNRDIKKSLYSYAKEIDFAYKKYDEKFPVIIIETSQGIVENNNKEIIRKIQEQYANLWLIHFTLAKQKQFFSDVFLGKVAYLQDHFLDTIKDYGKAMNKIFLLAVLFDVKVFHRRDSNTYLLNDFSKQYNGGFPIEIEIDYIGKPINGLEKPVDNKDKEITVVGSNYYGEWNMEIKDFARKDFKLIYKLYELLGFDKSVVKEICDAAFQFDTLLPQEELKLTLIRSVNDGENPDCGNMAMYKLFEEYPTLAARNTLASDYFVMDLATAMGKPSLHHNRVVFHEYVSSRFLYDRKLSYWEGVLKFCDYFNIYKQIYNGDLVNQFTTHAEIVSVIAKFSKENKVTRRESMYNIINEILLDFDENYSNIGTALISNVPILVEELNDEYDRHAAMVRDWPIVIEKCKQLNWRDYFA